MRRFLLEPISPFDFELTLEATPPAYPFVYENGSLRRAFKLESGKLVPVEVRSLGTIEEPLLEVTVHADVSRRVCDQIKRDLSLFLCLNDDLSEAFELMQSYEKLAPLMKTLRGVRPWTEMRPFEGLVCTVIFQQISIWAAFSIIRSLVERLGPRVRAKNKVFYEFPDARKLALIPTRTLKACKLSRNKSRYVRSLSKEFVRGTLNFETLAAMSSSAAIEELKKLKGIGTWTAEMFMATGLKRWDVIPADDLGLRRAVGEFCLGHERATAEDVREVAESWGKYKWPIAYYLLVASERKERLRA